MTGKIEGLIKNAIESTNKAHAIAQDSKELEWTGFVGAALISERGRIYTGINLSLLCGIGFCAEHSAIADMVKHGETRIRRIVATTAEGDILPPCGRCRELIYQIDKANLDTEIILPENRVMLLREMLPEIWQEYFDPFLNVS